MIKKSTVANYSLRLLRVKLRISGLFHSRERLEARLEFRANFYLIARTAKFYKSAYNGYKN